MGDSVTVVAGVELQRSRLTSLSLGDLYSWTIWQFPRKRGENMAGAVRPPLPGHVWYPALIRPADDLLKVYGHVKQTFSTPEAAADHLFEDPQS